MLNRFTPLLIEHGGIVSRYGYKQAATPGWYTIADNADYGTAMRVHNGFAVFTTQEQAAWACELMTSTFSQGEDAARAEIRSALGIAEAED